MTRSRSAVTAVILLAAFLSVSPARAHDGSAEGLLAAWEDVQRDDASTIVFEPVGDRVYRFHTNRFPYDGRLRVLNVSVDDTGHAPGMPFKLGFVEIELLDATEDFYTKYAQSYSLWQSRNTLYFDEEAGEWLSSMDWSSRLLDESAFSWPAALLSHWFWIALLAIFIAVVWRVTRRATRQFDSAMDAQDKALSSQDHAIKLTEHAVKIHEDSNRLLGEILAELRAGRGR